MAAADARPVPRKNVAYRVTFPILDADGDLVTGATGLDSEVSIDGATFADCTNEATEIATSSGVYYLDLTAAEMNGDTVAVIVKTSSSGAKTTTLVFYPEEVGDYRADMVQISGDTTAADNCESYFDGTGYTDVDNLAVIRSGTAQAGAAGTITLDASASASDDFYNNCYVQISSGTGANQARFITDYVGTTKVATVDRNWVTNPDATSVFIIWPFSQVALSGTQTFNVTGNITGNLSGSVGSVTGAVGSVTGNVGGNVSGSVNSVTTGVTVSTNNDKTGYSLTATTGLGNQTANITGNLSGSVGSVTAGVTVSTNNDKTGYGLSAAAVQAIWDALTTALTTAGSIGELLVDNINATISSRSTLDAAGVRTAVGLASANLDTQLDALPTAVENADTLLDRNMGTGTDSGSATVRTPRQALRLLRNKWSISAGTMTVTKEDDTTASWTAAVTTTAGDPVSTVDPASS